MREILFRGKIFDTEEWIYGGLIGGASEGNPVIIEEDFDVDETYFGVGTWASVLRKTVGQFTGLVDKNGVKIFEGDKVWWGWGNHGGLGWEHSGTVVVDINNYDDLHMLVEQHELEVIGNIHDNPELLESSPC